MDKLSERKKILMQLKKFVYEADAWDPLSTSEEGIFFINMPDNYKFNYQMLLQIKIKKNSNSSREKGVFIKNKKELLLFKDLINNKNIDKLFEEIESENELLKKILNLDDWAKIDCGISGISYVKMPNTETASLSLNPVNGTGKKIKRRDVYLRSIDDLEIYRIRFNNPGLENAVAFAEEINKEWKYHLDISKEKGKDRFFKNNKDFFNDEDDSNDEDN